MDKIIHYAKHIGQQIHDTQNIYCPNCIVVEEIEQPLSVIGDYENELFCPHCELRVYIKIEYEGE